MCILYSLQQQFWGPRMNPVTFGCFSDDANKYLKYVCNYAEVIESKM